ncbi:hypothetical protein K1X76_04510 [bacterium]|nr:hypothetical protein [bacterium]
MPFRLRMKSLFFLAFLVVLTGCESQIKQVIQKLAGSDPTPPPVQAPASTSQPTAVQPQGSSTSPQDPSTFMPVGQPATNPSGFPSVGTARSTIDNRSQVELKSGWAVTTGLNDKADIQIENVTKNLYFISLSEAKANLEKSMFLEKYSELTRQNLIRPLTDVRYSAPVYKTIGGYKALQYEITAKSDNLDIWYFHTIVETPTNYHQLISWTLKDTFSPNRTELESVIDSFKEL